MKIDEVKNLGAARIRIRSLIAAIEDRKEKHVQIKEGDASLHRVLFTKEMKKEYTIICPQMSPIHFELLEPAFRQAGYKIEVMAAMDKHAIETGLKYVNNDACYPALISIGQLLNALLSGKYDLNRTALLITQTGGGCRATNYIAFIRKALENMGMPNIPVISINPAGLEKNPGFKYEPALLHRALQAIVYGDLFMRVLYRTRPYEKVKGSANALHEKWVEKLKKDLLKADRRTYSENIRNIIREFEELPLLDIKKPRVGVVGEILVKFHPTANNDLVNLLEREGAEAVVPDLLTFALYCCHNQVQKEKYLGGSRKARIVGNLVAKVIEWYQKPMMDALEKSKRFDKPENIRSLGKEAEKIVSLCNQTGEGWFLTAEMIELIHSGVPNIVCTQPFGCLPNHVVGKGVIKELRKQYPMSNVVAIDYDPGASEVNQLNRIKLMLASANKNLEKANEHNTKKLKKPHSAERVAFKIED